MNTRIPPNRGMACIPLAMPIYFSSLRNILTGYRPIFTAVYPIGIFDITCKKNRNLIRTTGILFINQFCNQP
jgi:hypothetical protein